MAEESCELDFRWLPIQSKVAVGTYQEEIVLRCFSPSADRDNMFKLQNRFVEPQAANSTSAT